MMQVSRTYLIFVFSSIFAVIFKYLIYIANPNIAKLTDFSSYDTIFRGDAEDVGFYPVFIAIKNFFVHFEIPYPVFQIIVSSLYTISICTFILLSLKSLKLKSNSIRMASAFIVILYALVSYSSLKSFSLAKFYLSISILGFSCCTISPNIVRLASPSLVNLACALLVSPQTTPALILYSMDGIKKSFASFYRTLSNMRIANLSVSTKKIYRFIIIAFALFIFSYFLSLSPLLKDGSSEIHSLLYISLIDKLNAYLPFDILPLWPLLCLLCIVLIFILCFWSGSTYLVLLASSTLIVFLFGTNRFSPLVPFITFSLLSQRPLICIFSINLFLSYEIIKGIGLLM